LFAPPLPIKAPFFPFPFPFPIPIGEGEGEGEGEGDGDRERGVHDAYYTLLGL